MTKKNLLRRINCDISRLYGTIPEAIAYLQEIYKKHPEASLTEHWTGYEDMEMVFEFFEKETDEEYNERLRYERRQREYEKKLREEEEKREKAQFEKELEKLKKQYNIL